MTPTEWKEAQLAKPDMWESILGAVARGWCYEENANKTMDSELAVAIAKEVHALYTTPPHSFFEDVANELRVEIAELQDHIRLLEKQLAQPVPSCPECVFGVCHCKAQPEQEPVGKVVDCNELGYPIVHFGQALFIGTLLYTTPPQRTWVGLDEEDDIDWEEGGSLRDLVEAVEAKLKDKNT